MADHIDTLNNNLANFQDNVTGLITAEMGRILILSAMGETFLGAPTPDNDSVDSAGDGDFYAGGNVWISSLIPRYWVCLSGVVHAAVWQAMMYDGQAAGGDLSGTYPNPDIVTVAGNPACAVKLFSITDNTANGPFTLFDLSVSNGIMGPLRVMNNGPNPLHVHLGVTDAFGNVIFAQDTQVAGGVAFTRVYGVSVITVADAPILQAKIEIFEHIAGIPRPTAFEAHASLFFG